MTTLLAMERCHERHRKADEPLGYVEIKGFRDAVAIELEVLVIVDARLIAGGRLWPLRPKLAAATD